MKTTLQFTTCSVALLYVAKGMEVKTIYTNEYDSLNQLIQSDDGGAATPTCDSCTGMSCKGLSCNTDRHAY